MTISDKKEAVGTRGHSDRSEAEAPGWKTSRRPRLGVLGQAWSLEVRRINKASSQWRERAGTYQELRQWEGDRGRRRAEHSMLSTVMRLEAVDDGLCDPGQTSATSFSI